MVAAARVSRVSRFVLWLAFGWISAGAPVFKIHFARGAECRRCRSLGTFLQQMCLDGVERLLAVALVVLLACVSSFSQANLGRIAGQSPTRPAAQWPAPRSRSPTRKEAFSRTLTTDEAGDYNAPNLTPGTYTVRAEAKGFKTAERQVSCSKPAGLTRRPFTAARRAVPDDYRHRAKRPWSKPPTPPLAAL